MFILLVLMLWAIIEELASRGQEGFYLFIYLFIYFSLLLLFFLKIFFYFFYF